MKLIVLDAGDSFELDGFNKLLLKNPKSKKTIIEEYEEKYSTMNIDVVVGYNAIAIVNEFPQYNYIYNSKWQTTNNSYSLSLSLDNQETIVTSSDFFIKQSLIEKLTMYDNCIVVKTSENKKLNSLNVSINLDNTVKSIYYGKSKGPDFELMGIFKIKDMTILKQWKKNCINNPNLFVGENLPLSKKIKIVKVDNNEIFEVNTTYDYINFINHWEV